MRTNNHSLSFRPKLRHVCQQQGQQVKQHTSSAVYDGLQRTLLTTQHPGPSQLSTVLTQTVVLPQHDGHLMLSFIAVFLCVCYKCECVYLCAYIHVQCCAYRGQRITCGSSFSSYMWVLGIELRLLGLAAYVFTC